MLLNTSKKKRNYQTMMQDSNNIITFNDNEYSHLKKRFKFPRGGTTDEDVNMESNFWINNITSQTMIKENVITQSMYSSQYQYQSQPQVQVQTSSKALIGARMKNEMLKYRGEISKMTNAISYCPCGNTDYTKYC